MNQLENDLICFTTFRQGSTTNEIEIIRAEVFVDTINKLSKLNLQIVFGHLYILWNTWLPV